METNIDQLAAIALRLSELPPNVQAATLNAFAALLDAIEVVNAEKK